MSKKDDIELEMQETIEEEPAVQEPLQDEEARLKDEAAEMKEQAREEDPKLTPALTLRTILGGDFLTADMVRRQIWLFVLMVVFTVVYVAFRYQCQQDLIAIDKLEKGVLDAKYRALSCSSTLTEKCRESHVLEALKHNSDSLLHVANQPPYIINIPEEGE